MANKIVLKKSSVSSKVPLATDLEYGELALNYTDEKLYFKNASNVIKSLNVTPATLTIGTGLSGTSYNGTSAVTIAINSTVATLTGTQTLTNKTIAAGSNTISGLTNTNLSGSAGITNANLANSSVTIGSTSVSLGATVTTFTGLASVTSTAFVGALTGNASTATTLQTARTIGGVSFNGSANINLPGVNTAGNQNTTGNAASATVLQTARTINGVSFNGSANITVAANTTNALTIGTGLSGTSFNGSGAVTIAIDSTVATLTGTQTLTNKTLTSPRVGNGIFDSNGNEVLNIVPVASAVNELSISNAATGGSVLLSTAGTDTNINLLIQTKGTGAITIDTGTGAGQIDLKSGTSNVRVWDDDSSHYYQFVTGNRTANYNVNLPAGDVTLTAGTSVVTSRSISTTAPLAGGGDLSANRTLSLAAGYGDTLNPYASKTTKTFLAAPNAANGVPTFRTILASDIPTLNQNTTGSAATLTTARTINGVSFNGSANITVEPFVENDDSTDANRYITFVDSSTAGHQRLNEDSNFTYNPATGTVTSVGGFAAPVSLMSNNITTSYSIPAGYNAISAGPIAVASGVSITVPAGSVWTIV